MSQQLRDLTDMLRRAIDPASGALKMSLQPVGLQVTAEPPVFEVFDDFSSLDTALWTQARASTGARALLDTQGGVDPVDGWLQISSTNVDNDWHWAHTIKSFKLASGRSLEFSCRLRLTEANTNNANWVVGLTDVVDATLLGANGAGVPSSFDGLLFSKVDGGSAIRFTSSKGSTQNSIASASSFASGTIYTLGFRVDGQNGNNSIQVFVNGNKVGSQTYSLPSASLNLVMGVKAGGTNVENLQVDYIRCRQNR